VQKLYDDRSARLVSGERVFNSPLIDLFVKMDGALSEVYEVKTGIGRQMLYTAIGQLVTHGTTGNGEVAKFLVIPADEAIPKDFKQALAVLGIQILRFRLDGARRNKVVRFDQQAPHEKRFADAPQPAMRSANKDREPVPIASDAERPLPDARRNVTGRPEG
jgi:hypothetical protein